VKSVPPVALDSLTTILYSGFSNCLIVIPDASASYSSDLSSKWASGLTTSSLSMASWDRLRSTLGLLTGAFKSGGNIKCTWGFSFNYEMSHSD